MRVSALAAWHDAGASFAFGAHRVFFREDGPADGGGLLLIHGFPTASFDWAPLWPGLAASFRLVAPDLLGFGFSDKPRGHAYAIAEQADLCEALLRARGIAGYHVLAHDYGDTVAQELLARAGEQGERPALQGVCFLNGGLFPETHRPVPIQRLLLSPLGPLVARLTNKAAVARNLHRIFGARTPPDAGFVDACWELMTANDGLQAFPRLIRYMPERRRHRARWVGALQAARVPLHLIDGIDDPVSGRHMVDRYRELVPHPDITELPGIGHYPQVEAPQAVLDAYLAFRERVARDPPGGR